MLVLPTQYEALGASCIFATLWAMAKESPKHVGALLAHIVSQNSGDIHQEEHVRWVFTHSYGKESRHHAIRLDFCGRTVFYWNPPNPIRINGGTMKPMDICMLFPLVSPEVAQLTTFGATTRITPHDKQVAFRCVARYMRMREIKACAQTKCPSIVRGVLSDTVWHPYVTELLAMGRTLGDLGVHHIPRYDALHKHTQWAQYLFLGQRGPLSTRGVEWAADPDNEIAIKSWLLGAHLHPSVFHSGPHSGVSPIRIVRGPPEEYVIAGKKRVRGRVGPMVLEDACVAPLSKKRKPRKRIRTFATRRPDKEPEKHTACIAVMMEDMCALYVTVGGVLRMRGMDGYNASSPQLATATHALQASNAVDDCKNLVRNP
jgi:hypothetical protein